MRLTRSTVALLFLLCGLAQAQQIPKYEPNAQINYERIRGVTSYRTDSILVFKIGMYFYLGFSCPGDTGESPCTPSQVMFYFHTVGENTIDTTKRGWFILADNNRFQGQMKVNYDAEIRQYQAEFPINLATLCQLAVAESIEMQVGDGQVTLSEKDIATIGSFYNMAVLNAKQATTPKRGKPRRRKS